MKQCKTCNKKLNVGFFNEDSGDDCVFCANSRVTIAEVKKSDDYEVVDDVGCAGGACTL